MQSYGQSEVPGVITCLSRKDHFVHGDAELDKHLASAGRPSGRVRGGADGRRRQHRAHRRARRDRGPRRAGLPGYFNNPQATAEARAFGWHHTGDIGVFDENGYLYIVDRKKDMVISGGFNIYPSEIEQVIWGIPPCRTAPSSASRRRLGRAPDRSDRAQAGMTATADEIVDLCRKRFGSLKTPKQVEFWPTLPRSPSARC
jgi:acyl-coenzyme A synthetase/AMP-(fatty) acid ligase